MSFILDALKKLEREKAARNNAGINISEEILRGNYRDRRTGTRSPMAIAAVTVLALLVIGATVAGVMFWQRDSAVREAREFPGSGDFRSTAAQEQPGWPDAAKAPVGSGVTAPVSAPRSAQGSLMPAEETAPTRSPVKTEAGADPGEDTPERDQVGGPPSGADVKVAGIAWQEKRSARRAVVNGLLVTEGTPVDGFTVKEILQNRVRFQGNGRTFDVYISGPLLGETGPAPPPRETSVPNRPSRGETLNRNRPARDNVGNFKAAAPASAKD